MSGITLINSNIINGIKEYEKITGKLPPYVQVFTHDLKGNPILNSEQYVQLVKLQENGTKIFVHSTFNTVITSHWSIKQFMIQYQMVVENKYNGIVLHLPKAYDINMMSVLRLYFRKITEYHESFGIDIDYPVVYFEHVVNNGQYLIKPLDFVNMVKMIQSTARLINYKIELGICVDTCHVHSSGIPLSDLPDVIRYMSIIEKANMPILVHLNDSMTAFNSKKDRHGPIGENIWIDSVDSPKYLLKYPNIIELADPMSSVVKLL